MYPYNKAIDGSKANTFTATVHGDVIIKYQILIHENNTGVSVYTSDEISGTYYNGDTIIFVLPSSQLQNGKDLLWKIKLWDRNNNTLTSPPVFFKTRATPVVQVNEISSPHNRANVDFSGTYYQHQNVPIQYYIWNIYDAEDNLIDTSGKIYNSKLTYNYDGLLSGNTYKYQLVVVNQDNVQITSSKFSFSVYYDTYNYKIGLTPKVEILNDLNAAKIYLVGDKYSRGISTGRYSFVKDTPFIGANSVKINNGTIYYNEVSGTPLSLNEKNFTVVLDTVIDEKKTGEIIDLSSQLPSKSYKLIIKSHKFFSIINGDEKEVIPFFSTIKSGQTTTGEPEDDTGYIWDDNEVWYDSKFWTEPTPISKHFNIKLFPTTVEIMEVE